MLYEERPILCCVLLQVMLKAKQKGEQELLSRRERLMLELEKLGRRMEEFAECSELDMMQQVTAQALWKVSVKLINISAHLD